LGISPGYDWGTEQQAAAQAEALFASIGIGLASGVCVGAIIKYSCFSSPNEFTKQNYFTDTFIHVADDYPLLKQDEVVVQVPPEISDGEEMGQRRSKKKARRRRSDDSDSESDEESRDRRKRKRKTRSDEDKKRKRRRRRDPSSSSESDYDSKSKESRTTNKDDVSGTDATNV